MAETGHAPTPRLSYQPGLDGVRGLAILIVLASHAGLPFVGIDGGFAGVELFFVLSGYLITRILEAEFSVTGRVQFRAFYLRRALRLFPALFAVVVVVIVGYSLDAWPQRPMEVPAVTIAAVLGYVGNWVFLSNTPGVLGHAWSLSVEEQFYLLWPIVLVTLLRRMGPTRTAIAALTLSVLVEVWRVILLHVGQFDWVTIGTDTHADALLLGCAIALLRTRFRPAVGFLALLGVVALAVTWQPGPYGLLAWTPAAALASAVAVAGCPGSMARQPLAYIGRISYGLYLWHYLLIWWNWPSTPVITLSLAIAAASYRFLERPFLRIKSRFAPAADREPPTRADIQPSGIPA